MNEKELVSNLCRVVEEMENVHESLIWDTGDTVVDDSGLKVDWESEGRKSIRFSTK